MVPHIQGNDLELGQVVGRKRKIILPREARSTHLYVCGSTGTGKSKFLESLIRQDILANRTSKCGMLVIDPHGSLFDNTVAWLAQVGLDRPIIPIDLRRNDWIISYNLLRQRIASPSVIVGNIIEAMAHVWGETGTDKTPRFARWVGNLLYALYEKKYTLAEAMHLLSDQVELRQALTADLKDQMARRDWRLVNSLKPKEFEEYIESTVNRLERFIRNENLRTIFGQPDVSLDLGTAIDVGSIILVCVSREKARIHGQEADLFATLLLGDLWTAAQERGKRKNVKPFYVYIDEFQEFVTPTIAKTLDQARGFGLHLTMAHQFPNQLLNQGEHGKQLYDSIMENARNKVVFSLSHEENLKPLAQWLFRGVMDPDQVKHELYSTKVMSYCEEYRTAYSSSMTTSRGGTDHSSESRGEGESRSSSFDADNNPAGDTNAWNEHFSDSQGHTSSWSESDTEGTNESPMLIPIMGQELSHVQFRSLEEQLFRAMAVLFDQKQRQCVARLMDMRAPVSIFTPTVSETYISPERVERYQQKLFERLPFALRTIEAVQRLTTRDRELPQRVLDEARKRGAEDEPVTSKRKMS